jgi:hypothetical protein
VRYSYAKFDINGPQAFGAGGGHELVTLGGQSEGAQPQRCARRRLHDQLLDDPRRPLRLLQVRRGRPAERLRHDARRGLPGYPGLNLGDDFTSGLPFFELGNAKAVPAQIRFGSGLDAGRCNCPLAEHEKQAQVVANLTKLLGNHTVKFGVDVRRAYNLRVPSDSHRSGQLYFNADRTQGPTGGGLAIASFLLGDVQRMIRYVSPNTDARERQWRQFYYLQDTWRATPKLTLNYGLRADIINPQTVNEPGNGGWLDIDTGEIESAGSATSTSPAT